MHTNRGTWWGGPYRCLVLSLTLLCLGHEAQARPALYASRNSGSGSGGSGKLMEIDPGNGVATLIGASGYDGLSAITCLPSGVAYGALDSDGSGEIVTLNRADGSGTSVGLSGFAAVTALSVSAAGTLYGSATNATCSDTLVSIDPTTGVATSVGVYGPNIGGIDGLAFAADGTLYGVSTAACDTHAPGPALYTINPGTGAATLVGPLHILGVPLPDEPTGLGFVASGDLWATTAAATNDLIEIDPSNGAYAVAGDSDTGGELTSISFCGCDPAPDTGAACNTTAVKASVSIGDNATDSKDKFAWKLGGGTTTTADFGDPVGGDTNYVVCLYRDGALVLEQTVPHGGTCGDKPCWQATSTSGFKYADKAAEEDGVVKLSLKEGAGKAALSLKAKGINLPTPSLPLSPATGITLQFFRTEALPCWESALPAPARKDTAEKFVAKVP